MESRQQPTDVVRAAAMERLQELEQVVDLDCLAILGPIRWDVDDRVRHALEALADRKSGILVVLNTGGGLLDVAERIVTVLRQFYPDDVRFIVPDHAMSAGTLLAMSGNQLLMDYFSVLGPIDPQIERQDSDGRGRLVPALAYLDQVEHMRRRSDEGTLTTADVTMLRSLDLAELRSFELAAKQAVDLVTDWLVKYKLSKWTKTRTRGLPVDDKMRRETADRIASALNDHQRWGTHSRGINRDVLTRELRLEVEDFGANAELKRCVEAYYWFMKATVSPEVPFVHSREYM